MNNAQKIRNADARIKAVLEAHLHLFLNPFNAGLPSEEQIPFPRIFVNVDMVSLENLNGVDEYPVLSIYPSTVTTALDIIESQTVRTVWNVEAALFSYTGTQDFTARKSSYLANLAAQCLETYLPSVGNPCIYDVQLRQTLGTKRMQLSGTTMRGWSSVSTVEVYQRMQYGFSPSRVFTIPYEKPFLDNIPYFEGLIGNNVQINWNNETVLSVGGLILPIPIGILPNSEGTLPNNVSGFLVLPNNTVTNLTFALNPGIAWISLTTPSPALAPGDILYLTVVANNIPKITTIRITT